MDLWALNLKSGGGGGAIGPLWSVKRTAMAVRQTSSWRKVSGSEREGDFSGFLEVRVSNRSRRSLGFRSLEVRAIGKKKNRDDSSSPGSDDPSVHGGGGSDGSNSSFDESGDATTQKSKYTSIDWRTFRANLVAQEQVQGEEDSDTPNMEVASHDSSKMFGSRWAHPISMPETGCVLVATEKLDGVRYFERTVVLLLRLGTNDPREGPFGVIINQPLYKKIKHTKLTNPDLATTFADCSLQFGGPLDANMFLVRTREKSPWLSFDQVVPGIRFGARNRLVEAAGLVKKGVLGPQDFRFFAGYAGWQLDQLREEIESDYWIVAACSSDLVVRAPCDFLWEEILQLMGGKYSELSRKPKQDS